MKAAVIHKKESAESTRIVVERAIALSKEADSRWEEGGSKQEDESKRITKDHNASPSLRKMIDG